RKAREQEPSNCEDELPCVERVAKRLGATHAVWVRLAELASSVLVRVSFADIEQHRVQSAQHVAPDGAPSEEYAATFRMVREFVARLPLSKEPPPEERPWFWKWWPWAVIGTAVAGALATGVALAARKGESDEIVIVPPSPTAR